MSGVNVYDIKNPLNTDTRISQVPRYVKLKVKTPPCVQYHIKKIPNCFIYILETALVQDHLNARTKSQHIKTDEHEEKEIKYRIYRRD